ncbi:uncharacterized protein LOC111626055 isoform X2 [Centruroides sculpturatus]|nr:uncharacterized protein LOC111626055 isoform X2 [Centruroides sculpturatus]XP_023225104.1 uncharacterized protein LOC111626055 isoform X2 [Centruroides sculpturatus]
MPTSPNWFRIKRKPVKTPIIRLHGAPTIEPSKKKKVSCNKLLHIPERTVESPPRNRRRSLSLSSSGRKSPVDPRYLSLSDVRKESGWKERKNEFVFSASKRQSSRKLLKTAEGIRNLTLDPTPKKKFQMNNSFKHCSAEDIRNMKIEQNTIMDIHKKRNMFREQKTNKQSSIFNHDFDNGSVSSDEFSLKAYPPSLSTDSIDTSPIFITHSI